MDRVKRIWYLSPMRAAKVQASLRICAVSPEPSLLAHTSSESRGTFRQKARSLAPLNDWACAVKICHDGMLEDTNSLDWAHNYGLTLSDHKRHKFSPRDYEKDDFQNQWYFFFSENAFIENPIKISRSVNIRRFSVFLICYIMKTTNQLKCVEKMLLTNFYG